MAFRELQTAAARLVSIERASDASTKTLSVDFGIHPLDIESLLTAPVESSFSTFGKYALLTMLWPDPINNDLNEIRLVVDTQRLMVIGDTTDHVLRRFLDAVGTSSAQQHSTSELVHDIITLLTDALTTAPAMPSTSTSRRWRELSVVLRQLGRWLHTNGLTAAVPQLIIDAHRLDIAADRYQPTAEQAARAPVEALPIPRLVGAYALASAVVVVLVLATLSFR